MMTLKERIGMMNAKNPSADFVKEAQRRLNELDWSTVPESLIKKHLPSVIFVMYGNTHNNVIGNILEAAALASGYDHVHTVGGSYSLDVPADGLSEGENSSICFRKEYVAIHI